MLFDPEWPSRGWVWMAWLEQSVLHLAPRRAGRRVTGLRRNDPIQLRQIKRCVQNRHVVVVKPIGMLGKAVRDAGTDDKRHETKPAAHAEKQLEPGRRLYSSADWKIPLPSGPRMIFASDRHEFSVLWHVNRSSVR